MPASLASGQDALSTNPVARTRTLRTGCPQGAEAGCSFSLVTFSLSTQRESNSVAVGDRPLLILIAPGAGARTSRTTEGSPLWTGCAPTGADDRPLTASDEAKSVARERAPATRSRPSTCGAINGRQASPARAPRSPASATARPGACRSRLRNNPTSPSMLADSRARNSRVSEDIARPRRRRPPSG